METSFVDPPDPWGLDPVASSDREHAPVRAGLKEWGRGKGRADVRIAAGVPRTEHRADKVLGRNAGVWVAELVGRRSGLPGREPGPQAPDMARVHDRTRTALRFGEAPLGGTSRNLTMWIDEET